MNSAECMGEVVGIGDLFSFQKNAPDTQTAQYVMTFRIGDIGSDTLYEVYSDCHTSMRTAKYGYFVSTQKYHNGCAFITTDEALDSVGHWNTLPARWYPVLRDAGYYDLYLKAIGFAEL